MTAIASPLSTAAPAALAAPPAAGPVSLASFLDMMPPTPATVSPGKGEVAGGKPLPVGVADEGEGADGADAAFAWMAITFAAPTPVATPVPTGATAAPYGAAISDLASATPLVDLPGEGRGPVASGPMPDPGLRQASSDGAGQLAQGFTVLPSPRAQGAPDISASAVPGAISQSLPVAANTNVPDAGASDVPLTTRAPRTTALDAAIRPAAAQALPATIVTALSSASTMPAPAAQVFADAIHRAVTRADERPADPAQPAPAPTAITAAAVAATAQPHGAALDMRHDHWPQAMVERIAMLRDMAAENDTSLRLSPDALGHVDVSLRRDGDAVSVQITAAEPHARQLLADAQPRLAELAAERGIRLLQGGAGTAADTPRQQSPQGSALPAAPARVLASGDDATSSDQRIA